MIVVTGACGFIGSCLIAKLNSENFNAIIAVDDFSKSKKLPNLIGKKILKKLERTHFFEWLDQNSDDVEFIFHLGARTDTAETNRSIFDDLNLNYSKEIWRKCISHSIPLIYASSAATYGNGEHGFNDNHQTISALKPLNEYARSKNEFDKWVITQSEAPLFWAGFKFFNVYGPNENHKSKMASVIFHAFHQISQTGQMKLFKSHNSDYKDGEQTRDFIYIKDLVSILYEMMHQRSHSGIYNLGTGNARTFNDLANSVFASMNLAPDISYVDTPLEFRKNYQYFTEANMKKLGQIGINIKFHSLESGIADYISEYLIPEKSY